MPAKLSPDSTSTALADALRGGQWSTAGLVLGEAIRLARPDHLSAAQWLARTNYLSHLLAHRQAQVGAWLDLNFTALLAQVPQDRRQDFDRGFAWAAADALGVQRLH